MIFVGIDPGLNGAIAINNGHTVKIIDTPTTVIKSGKKNKTVYRVNDMVNQLREALLFDEHVEVAIETQQSMPGQGVSSMFSLGYGFGLWVGIVAALGYSYTLVHPKKWKSVMMDGMGKEKAASCVRAQQLHPDLEFFTPRGRALDGRGDAVLIMDYIKNT